MKEELTCEEYKLLVEKAPIMIWRSAITMECDYFNEIWLAFTGRSMKEEVGNGWAEGVHPEDFDNCLKIYTEHFTRRENFEMEYRLRRFDGVYRWIFDRGVPFNDSEGNFKGYIGSCIDVTERIEAQEALKKAQEAEIKQLRGFLPICASCKKIRDDKGFWNQVEKYISERTEAEFSHGICPECAQKLYPDIFKETKVTGRPIILLVDDEEDFRMIFIRQIKRILKDQDIEFVEASNGEEALNLLKTGLKPSMIILDYAMPKINGMDLLRSIDLEHKELYDIPRIMISGYDREDIKTESQNLRCDFFIKSVDTSVFYQNIWQHMAAKLGFSST